MTVSPQGTLILQRFTNVFCLRTYYGKKGRHSFNPQCVTPLGEDSICMVNLLETPPVIVFFFDCMIELLQLFQKRSFVLSGEHEKSKCGHSWYTVRSIHVKL